MGKLKDRSIFDAAFNDFKNGLTITETCRKHPICEETFCKYVKLNGHGNLLPVRNNTANYSYFKEIDSEEKAYFLGLIMADGYIEEKKNGVTIGLSGEEDTHILERFKECTQFSGKINEKKINYTGAKRHFRVSIYSKEMVNDLASYGIVPRKSLICDLTEKFPSKYLRPFFRGLFDGDGGITFKTSGSFCADLIGSEKLISRMCNIYFNETGLKPFVEIKGHNRIVKCGGVYSSFCFLDWIYANSNIHLNRKYEKYLHIKNEVINRLNNIEKYYCAWNSNKTYILKSSQILGIDLSEYIGSSLSISEQKKVINIFSETQSVAQTSKITGFSKKSIENLLKNQKPKSDLQRSFRRTNVSFRVIIPYDNPTRNSPER